MNQIALPANDVATRPVPPRAATKTVRRSNSVQAYVLLSLLVVLGWMLRDHKLINPDNVYLDLVASDVQTALAAVADALLEGVTLEQESVIGLALSAALRCLPCFCTP